MKPISAIVCSVALLAASGVFAAESPLKKGHAAFGSWKEDKPGVTRLISPDDLGIPDESQSSENSAEPIQMPQGTKPLLPKGFSAELVASGVRARALSGSRRTVTFSLPIVRLTRFAFIVCRMGPPRLKWTEFSL